MPETNEIKLGDGQPEQKEAAPEVKPNQGPSAEELQKQNKELQERYEAELKARDAKISDLETTKATIEARERQIKEASATKADSGELEARIARINDIRAYDPKQADSEMARLLTDIETKSAEKAALKVQQEFTTKTYVEKLRDGVKSTNQDFDDDIVDVVMTQADVFARTGRYKTADEAVKAATDLVKLKFETYAKKKNAVPPLPSGAMAENGGANQPPKPPEPEKVLSLSEEIEKANEEARKKRFL
jgi:hypothetical protein